VQPIDRRSFLETSYLGASIALLGAGAQSAIAEESKSPLIPAPKPKKNYRAAAIGWTGRGDFGHGVDLALVDLPSVEFVAIANPDHDGLNAAAKRCGIDRTYADYRQMLEAEDVDLVAIGMRHSDVHEDVVVHCANTGKHIYCEKPLAIDLASFDRMATACDDAKVKLAVALVNRASPAIQQALSLVRDGRLGRLLSLRAMGKCDHRGGGEDLMVLGYHNLDLMSLFAGTPQWTFAQVLEGDRGVTRSDARKGNEPIGLVAGDCVAAMFGFPNQVHGYFQSHRNLQAGDDRFSLEIHGSDGIITARSLADVMWLESPVLNPAKPHQWKPIEIPEWNAIANKYHWCHQRLILDLLSAAEEDREPMAGIHNTRWTQEMIQSVYVSHLAAARVPLPLPPEQRTHPLSQHARQEK
jgi:predicted dehydrogenase